MNKEKLKKKILEIIQEVNKFDTVFWSNTIFAHGQDVYIKEIENSIIHIKYGILGHSVLLTQAKKDIEDLFCKENIKATVNVIDDPKNKDILWLEIIKQ